MLVPVRHADRPEQVERVRPRWPLARRRLDAAALRSTRDRGRLRTGAVARRGRRAACRDVSAREAAVTASTVRAPTRMTAPRIIVRIGAPVVMAATAAFVAL